MGIKSDVVVVVTILFTNLSVFSCSTLCYSGSGELEGFCYDRTITNEEDVHIVILASIHEPLMGRYCGEISPEGLQSALAVEWILNLLNGNGNRSQSFIPGVRLGYNIVDDCGLASRSTDTVMHELTGTKPQDLLICTAMCGEEDTPLLGILLLTSMESTVAAHNSMTPNIPVITARSPMPKGHTNSNLYSTVPSLATDVQVTLELMQFMRWNMIAIVYTEDELGQQLWSLYEPVLQKAEICGIYISSLPLLDINHQMMDEKLQQFVLGLEETQVQRVEEEKFGVLYLGDVSMFKEIQKYLKSNRIESALIYRLQWLLPSVFGQNNQLSTLIRSFDQEQYILSLSPSMMFLPEFRDFFAEVLINSTQGKNESRYYPWAEKYISTVYGQGTLDKTNILSDYKQSGHVSSAVLGVLSFATVLKGLHEQQCGGSYGLCGALKSVIKSGVSELFNRSVFSLSSISEFLPQELQTQTELFVQYNSISTENGEVVNVTHYSKSADAYQQVALYENNSLHISSADVLLRTKSVCRDTCTVCAESHDIKFAYIPGDFLILGLFSLHEDGSSSEASTEDLYKCGKFRDTSNSVITVLSFIEGIKMFNSINTGFNFGGIALDDCYNPLNISHLLAELFSGKRILRDPYSGSKIDFKNVIAVVGALSSTVTQIVADQMTSLNIPMISYGASSAELDDSIRYPFFLRTVPSDTLQVEGLVSLLKELSFTHVGAVYIDDAYGANGIRSFRVQAEKNGICVEIEKKISEDFTDAQIDDLIEKLNKERVKVVLFYAIDTTAEKLLRRLAARTDIHFTFIASEAWGTNANLASSTLGTASAGTLVFVTGNSGNNDESFKSYLQNITTSFDTGNPWMPRFWEDIFECDHYGSYDRRFSKTCSNTAHLNTNQVNSLSSYQRVVHVRYAIYAIGNGYARLCPRFTGCSELRNKTMATTFTERIRDTELQLSNGDPFRLFKDDGNGYLGFTIHNIQQIGQQGSVTYEYVEVGSYSVESQLTLRREDIKFYREGTPLIQVNSIDAECSPIYQSCEAICPVTTTPVGITSTMAPIIPPTPASSGSEQTIIISVFGAVVGILLLIVILLIISMCRQNRATEQILQTKAASVVASHISQGSLDLYDEPRSLRGSIGNVSKGKWNSSFERDDTAASSSSGIGFGSRDVSNGTANKIRVPTQYSDIKHLQIPEPHSDKYGSKSSVASYLAPASPLSEGSSIPRIEVTQDDMFIPNKNAVQKDSSLGKFPERGSADDITTDAPSLNYMTAKDLQMEEEDISVDSPMSPTNLYVDRKSNTARYVPQNDTEIPQPSLHTEDRQRDQQVVKRPKTLPGINPRVINKQPSPRKSEPVHLHNPFAHQPPMYLNPVDNLDSVPNSFSPAQGRNPPSNMLPTNPAYIYSDDSRGGVPFIVTPAGEILSPAQFVHLQSQSPLHGHQIADGTGAPSPVRNRRLPTQPQRQTMNPVVQNVHRMAPQSPLYFQNPSNSMNQTGDVGRYTQQPVHYRHPPPPNIYSVQQPLDPTNIPNNRPTVANNVNSTREGPRSLSFVTPSQKLPIQNQRLSHTLPTKQVNTNQVFPPSTQLMPDVVSHEAIELEDENEVMI